MAAVGRPECIDFLQFQDILKKMRESDDKIIYALNTRLPTESFRQENDFSKACQELFGELQENFKKREQAIQNCITFARDKVVDLKKKKESNLGDTNIHKELKKEQSKINIDKYGMKRQPENLLNPAKDYKLDRTSHHLHNKLRPVQ